jgi:hypothetical protein
MKVSEDIANLVRFNDIESPEFVKHVLREFPDNCVLPDDRDFNLSVNVWTDVQAAEQYQLAQARKVGRMYRAWKAGQN